ncbi:hypothetical protein PHO31112_00231 [Pandoraea horticolens]|uniref:Uncharacterized protein n=1 Tax=Pandoraea horticolens TaxID=2508298 RepID=A0A5E4RMY6_9BURK|nr:hypothetical protein [Pandoraea horticolens]VVD63399.1 hypothetical protein PHO31112_00231 [Pandoraea horticolens]
MPYLSCHRLTNATAHYGIPSTASHRESGPRSPFASELRHVRIARATMQKISSVIDTAAHLIPQVEQRPVPSHPADMATPSPTTVQIENEHAFPQGYEHVLPRERLPADARTRLMVNGHDNILGEASYYRATPARDGNHWLIDAPQGSDMRAQVPVTYDRATGQWLAHTPLRPRGGGCTPSREDEPDSIEIQDPQIADAVRHVPEEHVRAAIERAFHEVSRLHLVQSHRENLRSMPDDSMTQHGAALNEVMKQFDPTVSLLIQQREAALSTATHYYWNRGSEALGQENTEVLFHYLLEHGVPGDRIRMITVQPSNRPPHVMVLYTESQTFLDLLELATPQPPMIDYFDGVDDASFSGWLYMTRETSVLLDPWSTVKIRSFAHTTSERELIDALDGALVDTGHRPGSPYVVSITRALRGRHSTDGHGNGVSPESAGASDPDDPGHTSSASGTSGGVAV